MDALLLSMSGTGKEGFVVAAPAVMVVESIE